MENEILEEYEKVKDKLSEEEFLEKMKTLQEEYDGVSFMDDVDIARMIVGNYVTEKNEVVSEKEEHAMDSISKLESGAQNVSVIGKIMGISNPKKFTSRKGKDGQLCNVKLADDTGEIRAVFWTENIKLLKKVKEGDIIQVNSVEVKNGYSGNELQLNPRSTIHVLDNNDYPNFPQYEEPITPISDIKADTQVNIIGRIIRVSGIRTYEKNGKENQVASFEIQDASGKTEYTLWRNDALLIESLGLAEGDSVKILGAQAREYNGDVSLSHWDGRVIKGDFDVPEYEETFIKIAEAHEKKDVSLIGLVTKIQDTITFQKKDGGEGYVKSIEIMDDGGSIRVTLWGNDTNLEINKGDILKITGGNIEFDEYAPTGYRVNTNWNSNIVINPTDDNPEYDLLKEYCSQIGPVKIEEVQGAEDDGEEVDIIGRVISVNDIREFQRDDGSTGIVRSIDFADETGIIRLSFWDDKAQENFKPGDAYQIENARTKMGMYAVDLNIGKTSRVIKLTDDEASILPSFETLEQMIFTQRKISDLDEDDRNIRVIGRIIDIQEPRDFQRQDGTPGLVRNIDIADDTGSIRVTLWNSSADSTLELGQAIKLENPRINFNEDRLELSVNDSSNMIAPSDDELKELPSYEELQDIIYESKSIESLNESDLNVKISGTINDPYGNKILLTKCPNCGNNLEQDGDESICDFCSEEIDKPRYILMIPARLEDDTGDIQITFFGNLVEDLLEMKLDEIVSIIEDSGDFDVLEGKVEDLNGLNVEVIADVNFDDYNEEIRLSPKKILSKKY
ncbi:OB-fold nucleic acid binding domain-containing protein [Methanobrevibacter sp. DSM 116169]|uniref:OB-fold nucleic acid binding domain-containing protein n=1 Tax=Methanobrevibacter sp. DSM 116169 TaxID=3242727 RepID=UPI0038FBEFCA